jgi:hypothetical protein
MSQKHISIGAAANDGTGTNWRTAWGNTEDNFTDLYSQVSHIISAGEARFASAPTTEARIALADAACVAELATILFIPAFMVPYDITLCPATPTVKRVLEGRNFGDWDVDAYGAFSPVTSIADPAADGAFAAAIASCYAFGGGRVYARGRYRTTTDIILPVTQTLGVVLCGAGMRSSYIYPSTPGQRGVLLGTATPDASGTSTYETQYPGIEDISVSGSLLTTGTSIGVQFTEVRKGWIRNCIIEHFTAGASIGLYLRGSTTTGVSSPAAPHVWRCNLTNVVVATTMRPLVVENADECDFYNCNFHLPTGLSSGTNVSMDFYQGHNCRFFGCVAGGDTNVTFRPNYQGVRFRNPTAGENEGHQFYGLVVEGCDIGFLIDSSVVANVAAYRYESSLNRVAFSNGSEDGAASGERGNNVIIDIINGLNRNYRAGRNQQSEHVQLPTGTTPSVAKGNTFYCANGGGTAITKFLNGTSGQMISVLLDANTSITHGTGTDNIECPGAATITAAAKKMVTMVLLGGAWRTLSVSLNV